VKELRSERQVSVWDFMRCLDTWAAVYKTHDPKLQNERREFLEHWNFIRRKVKGNNQLMYLQKVSQIVEVGTGDVLSGKIEAGPFGVLKKRSGRGEKHRSPRPYQTGSAGPNRMS
jgi:hypothetical protein